MLRFILMTAVLFLTSMFSGGSAPLVGAEGETCPSGTLPFPAVVQCAPVVDQTWRSWTPTGPGPNPRRIPSPGYSGGAVWYKDGFLDPSEGAELYTGVIAYPNGLGQDLGCSWGWRNGEWVCAGNNIAETAVNRSHQSMEIVLFYYGAGNAEIKVFDWSCSADYPCEHVQTHERFTSESFVLSTPLRDNPCYMDRMTNSIGTNGDWQHMF